MTNENHSPKTISQWDFDYGLFTNLPTIIVACDFSPRTQRRYLLENAYPNLKTTCHIKLNFSLWNKLLERLLLAKYLTFVTAPLNSYYFFACFNFLILSLVTLSVIYIFLPFGTFLLRNVYWHSAQASLLWVYISYCQCLFLKLPFCASDQSVPSSYQYSCQILEILFQNHQYLWLYFHKFHE